MNDLKDKIIKELIAFQTSAYYSKSFSNYVFSDQCESNNQKFDLFQNRVFSMIDKIRNGNFKFTADELLLIEKLKSLIIKNYQSDALIMDAIRNDSSLSESYDSRIAEVNELFTSLKKEITLID